MNKAFDAITGFMVTGLMLGACGLAAAQNAEPSQGRAGSEPATPQASSGADDRSMSAPVLHITSVEVIRSTHMPVLDVVRVRGLTSTSGWEEAELIPLTRGVP